MFDEIFAFAKAVGQVESGEEEILSRLCRNAEEELKAKLKQGIDPEACRDAFVIAAAWMALADLCIGCQDGMASWSAGDVSVKRGMDVGVQAAVYRGQAKRLMAPYCMDDEFIFVGVEG